MYDYTPPTYYVMGEEVKLRGVSIETFDTDDKLHRRPKLTLHVQFDAHESTREIDAGAIKVEGGLSALYDDLRVRGLAPDHLLK